MPTRTGGMGPVGPASGKPPVAGPSRDSWPGRAGARGRAGQGPAVSGMVGAACKPRALARYPILQPQPFNS